jgi:hypothetical protein
VARLGEEAGGFEQAEAIVVHGVLIEDEEDEHVPDEGCTRRGSMVLGTALRRHPRGDEEVPQTAIRPQSYRNQIAIRPQSDRNQTAIRSTSDRG